MTNQQPDGKHVLFPSDQPHNISLNVTPLTNLISFTLGRNRFLFH